MNEQIKNNNNTVYIANLPFTLTNNDLFKIFQKHGKIFKVTIVKEPVTRTSKGIAFIQFFQNADANKCVASTNNTQMFGRTLKSSIAKDNGRSSEFAKNTKYSEQPRTNKICYECGGFDHLSYKCKLNVLGEREPPVVKKKQRVQTKQQKKLHYKKNTYFSDDEEVTEE